MIDSGVTYDYGKILSDDEIESIRTHLKSNRDVWRHITEYEEDDGNYHSLNFVGSPIYMNTGMLYKQYRKKSLAFLNTEPILHLQSIVSKNLEFAFQRPAVHLPYTSLPGFHIFNASEKRPHIYTGGFHVDNDLHDSKPEIFPKIATFNDVYACATVIETCNSGDGLDYIQKNIDIPAGIGYTSEYNTEKFSHLNYVSGHMYMWKSKTIHRVAESKLLTDNDYRITYQMHLIQTPEAIYYYW